MRGPRGLAILGLEIHIHQEIGGPDVRSKGD
jgi:hypothetical protein